jgi:AraC-like DNA-binding protein
MPPADLAALSDAATRLLPAPNGRELHYLRPFAGLGILRQPRPTALEAAIYEPAVVFVLQGRKETVLGVDRYPMRAGDCLLVSHDLPVVARIVQAPYLALVLDVDLDTLRDLQDELGDARAPAAAARALAVHAFDARLADALRRQLELAADATDAAVLGPLVAREIHYRLSTAPFGGQLRELGRRDSHASAIARAIARLRREFRSPVEIPELARSVGMSASSFHKHFKAITASSPLQYRKGLQLLEARRLLRAGATAVSSAAFDVGYESPAQFSRDYARRFGAPPRSDLPAQPR